MDFVLSRPVTISTGPLGVSSTLERPTASRLQDKIALNPEIPELPKQLDTAAAQLLERRAVAMLERLKIPGHAITDRPGGHSTAVETLVEHMPWLSPRSVAAMMTLDPNPLPSRTKASTPRQGRSGANQSAEQLREPAQDSDRARNDLRATELEHAAVAARLGAARETISAHEAELSRAIEALKPLQTRSDALRSSLAKQPSFSVGRLRLNGKLRTATGELEAAASLVDRRQSQLQPLRSELARLEREELSLADRMTSQRALVDSADIRLHGNDHASDPVAERLRKRAQEFSEALNDLNKSELEHSGVAARLEAARGTMPEVQTKLHRAIDAIRSLQAKSDALSSNLAKHPSFSVERLRITDELRAITHELNSTVTSAEGFRSELRQLRSELLTLEPAERALADRMQAEKTVVVTAGQRLRGTVVASELVDAAGAALTAELSVSHLDFVYSELRRMNEAVNQALKRATGDPERGIPGETEALQEMIEAHAQRRNLLMEGYQTAVSNLAIQEHNLASLDSEIFQSRQRRLDAEQDAQTSGASPEAQQMALAEIEVLNVLEPELLLARGEANARVQKAADQVDDLVDEAEVLETELDNLMRKRHESGGLADAATKASDALVEPLAEAQERLHLARAGLKDAIEEFDELESKHLTNLLLLPPGFEPSAATAELGNMMSVVLSDWPVRPRVAEASSSAPAGASGPGSSSSAGKSPEPQQSSAGAAGRIGTKDALPKLAVAEALSLALSQITSGDAGRATALLETLRTTPTMTFIPRSASDVESASSSSHVPNTASGKDVQALFRLLAPLPRGAEMLQLIGASPSGEVWDSKKLSSLRIYWCADAAIETESKPQVREWLKSAQRVAAEHMHYAEELPSMEAMSQAAGHPAPLTEREHLDNKFGERELGAYNAVRNGYTSNAPDSPYAEHDARLRDMVELWMDRGKGKFEGSMLSMMSPERLNTPFKSSTLRQASKMADRFGINTNTNVMRQTLVSSAEQLNTMAQAVAKAAPNEELGRFNLAISVLAQYMAERSSWPGVMTPKDFKVVQERYAGALNELPAGSSQRSTDLPEELASLMQDAIATAGTTRGLLFGQRRGGGVSGEEVLSVATDSFLERNKDNLDEDQRATLRGNFGMSSPEVQISNRLSHSTAYGRSQRIQLQNKEDVLAYFGPMLETWNLRDKLKLSGGASVGVGLPFLPYRAPAVNQQQVSLAAVSGGALAAVNPLLVTPTLTAAVGRKDEAFVQLFQPILGIELLVGSNKARSAEVAVGVNVGSTVGNVGLSGSGTARIKGSDSVQTGTAVRFLRPRNQDDIQRKNMLTALESIVLWDKLQPANEPGGRFAGPMEALLARSPDAAVTRFDSQQLSAAVATSGNVSAGWTSPAGAARFGLFAGGSAEVVAERALEKRSESAAAVSVQSDKTSIGKQTVNLEMQARLPFPQNPKAAAVGASQDATGARNTQGAIGYGSVPWAVSASREMAQHLQKHGISPFRINNKQDGDLDRHYFSPKEMLAEISTNREFWLMRCLENLPPVNGQNDTPENRATAHYLLDKFTKDIEHLGKTSQYCQYNVNYSMRPQASAWIDGLRLVGDMSAIRGDETAKQAAVQAIDNQLSQPSTWRPLMLIVREKGKDSKEVGFNFGIKWKTSSTVEGQRTAAQFPPP